MTTRLYLSDPWLVSFDARVLASRTLGGAPAVVLDRTAFYPEGGGQPADRGTLSGVAVLDVQEVEDEVLHALASPLPEMQDVHGEVDRARRRDHVQQHHGQHLLSAAFAEEVGAQTLSFHLGEETCTIDLDAKPSALDEGVLRRVEARANELVFLDLPVSARDRTQEELRELLLRKKPAKGSRVVLVGEPGNIVDASPCGGTHPRRTGEVGVIAVLRAQKWAEGTRVEFVCGARVVKLVAVLSDRLSSAAQAFRCAPAEVPAAAVRATEEANQRKKDLERLLFAAAEAEAERLAQNAEGPVVRSTTVPPVPGALAWMRAVGQALASKGKVALLGALEDGRAHLVFTRARGEGPHLGQALKAAVELVEGKGGGSPDAAQGSGPKVDRLDLALLTGAKQIGS